MDGPIKFNLSDKHNFKPLSSEIAGSSPLNDLQELLGHNINKYINRHTQILIKGTVDKLFNQTKIKIIFKFNSHMKTRAVFSTTILHVNDKDNTLH